MKIKSSFLMWGLKIHIQGEEVKIKGVNDFHTEITAIEVVDTVQLFSVLKNSFSYIRNEQELYDAIKQQRLETILKGMTIDDPTSNETL